MWSDRYYYWNIYRDEFLSETKPTKDIVDFIGSIPQLVQHGEFEFRNRDSFHHVQMLILRTSSPDSWSNKSTSASESNMISIVCEKGRHVEIDGLKEVFIPIAEHLKWKLVDEETDDGIENHIIWEPK